MKVDNNSQPVEASVSVPQEPKSTWENGASYFGNEDKVEGFSHSDSEDEQENECREDATEPPGLDCESSNSREVLGASISNSFDSIVDAPSEECPNDETNDRPDPSSLSLSASSTEKHQEAKAQPEDSVKTVATEETNESESSARSRDSARSAASILDDESFEEDDACDDIIDAKAVKRKSRIEELKEQLGLVERQISDSSSEESEATESISICNDSIEIMSPAPSMDSAYVGEVDIPESKTEDSIQLKQESSSSTGIASILVKTSSDDKKKKNSEKRVQFDLASVETPPPPAEEPKSLWDLLDNMLVNTDLGILDRSCKEESVPSKQKSLMDEMSKEATFENLDESLDDGKNFSSSDRLGVDFKAIDRMIAANHRHPNRLPSIPECTEQSFEASTCDDQSMASNMSESAAERKITAESATTADADEPKEEKQSFFSGWNCGNLKCVTPEAKDMCGPTMKLPGMIALQQMNDIPMNENLLLHWSDSEQQNESITRSIQMANEHVNGAKAYLSMIDGVDSDDDESTVVSESTARASNKMGDMNDDNSSVASFRSEYTTDTDHTDCTDHNEQEREQVEPPGWQTAPTPVKQDFAAPSVKASPVPPIEDPFAQDDDKRHIESVSSTARKPMDPPTSPKSSEQETATMEISEARKSRMKPVQKTSARKPDPESFEASKPETKPAPMAESKAKTTKKAVSKQPKKKMDPTETKPKASKPSPAKKTVAKAEVDQVKPNKASTPPSPESTLPKSEPTDIIPTPRTSNAHRRAPTPELNMMPAKPAKVELKVGSNQDCPIVLVEEEEEEPVKEETRDESSDDDDDKTASSSVPEQDENVKSRANSRSVYKRLSNKMQQHKAERLVTKDKFLSQMPPLYALKPDEICLILEIDNIRDYLSNRKSYNLAYEQARWCVLAAQSNTDQTLTNDMIQEIIREECQRFRE